MFAQIPEPKSLLDFLLVVGFLSSIVTNLAVMWRSGHPQKRQVSFADAYATKPEVAGVDVRVEKMETHIHELRDEIQGDRLTLMHAGEERVLRLQDRMDEMAKDVNERFESLNRRFDEMPLKLIQLLRK